MNNSDFSDSDSQDATGASVSDDNEETQSHKLTKRTASKDLDEGEDVLPVDSTNGGSDSDSIKEERFVEHSDTDDDEDCKISSSESDSNSPIPTPNRRSRKPNGLSQKRLPSTKPTSVRSKIARKTPVQTVSQNESRIAKRVGPGRKPGPKRRGRKPLTKITKTNVAHTSSRHLNSDRKRYDDKLSMTPVVRLVDCVRHSVNDRSLKRRIVEPERPSLSNAATIVITQPSPLTSEIVSKLVMPSQDWFVNTYPQNVSQKFTIFTISESILTNDSVEIIRKSITLKSDWTVKFTVFAQEIPNFKIMLNTSKVYEIQRILCHLAEATVCTGFEIKSNSRVTQAAWSHTQTTRKHVDGYHRSLHCRFIMINQSSNVLSSNYIAHSTSKICEKCDFLKKSFGLS